MGSLPQRHNHYPISRPHTPLASRLTADHGARTLLSPTPRHLHGRPLRAWAPLFRLRKPSWTALSRTSDRKIRMSSRCSTSSRSPRRERAKSGPPRGRKLYEIVSFWFASRPVHVGTADSALRWVETFACFRVRTLMCRARRLERRLVAATYGDPARLVIA